MKYLMMFAVATALVATACTSSTTPTDSKSYISSKVGAYVIHNNTSYSTTDGETTDSPDSTVVTGTRSYTDDVGVTKTAIIHVVFIDGMAVDTIVLAEDGSKVYMLFDLDLEAGDVVPPVSVGTRWVQVADANATSSWTSLEETITDVDFDYNGTTFPADVTFKLSGAKIADTTMSVGGTNVAAIKYSIDYSINMLVKVGPPFGDLTIPIALKSNIYLGENLGMVRQSQDATTITIPLLGQGFDIDGFNSVAVRFGGN
jgi:hypothetical protein